MIEEMRKLLATLDDGEISPSAYDTAWVARIPSQSNATCPEFPETLEWIAHNQLPDGSWGDRNHFQIYDRVLSTVSCLVALKTWNLGHDNINKGERFLKQNIYKLTKDKGDLLCGFELIFMTMLEEAKQKGLDIPIDIPALKILQGYRQKKLQKIPLEMVHSIPTTILYSLEGLQDHINWEKILQFIGTDGSFLSSPSATACVYMHTKDPRCLEYLKGVVKKVKNSVPCQYAIDLFERLWIVDTLERLGIDRYFQPEIKNILDYVYKYWSDKKGIGWGRESYLKDIDDTSMGFRLLRLHGYKVTPDVFLNFMSSEDKFFCFPGESYHGASDIFNLYRASQVAFANDNILTKAKNYAHKYLSQLDKAYLDKWSAKKNFFQEVEFELSNQWNSCLPRAYSKSYIHNYGPNDIWIAKTIYRLPFVNNELFINLAKEDFNACQSIHQSEIQTLLRWWAALKFGDLPFFGDKVVTAHFSIASCMFEPEFSELRLFYTKYALLSSTLDDLADYYGSPAQTRCILEAIRSWDPSLVSHLSEEVQICFSGLYRTINEMVKSASKVQTGSSINIREHMQEQLAKLISAQLVDAEWMERKHIPSFETYLSNATVSVGMQDLLLSSIFFCGESISKHLMQEIKNSRCLQLTCLIARLCNDIGTYQFEREKGEVASSITCYMRENRGITESQAIEHLQGIIDESWKELTEEFLTPSQIPRSIKRLMFETARIFQFIYPKKDNFKDPSKAMASLIQNVLYKAAE
nr:labda-7,13E-dien-15-ol producing bifunctional diterpene synthase [Selaginella moellendorffii]